MMRKPEMSGRIAKWSIQLSTYILRYEPRSIIKSKALTDFIMDLQREVEKEVQWLQDT